MTSHPATRLVPCSLSRLRRHYAPPEPVLPPPIVFSLPQHVSAAPIQRGDALLHFWDLSAFYRVFHFLLEAPLLGDASQCCAHLPQDEPHAITTLHQELIHAFLKFLQTERFASNKHLRHQHASLQFVRLPASSRILAAYSAPHRRDAWITVQVSTRREEVITGADRLWHYLLSELLLQRAALEFQSALLATLGGAYAALGNAEKALQFAKQQKRTAAALRNARLYYISDVYVTYYYISKHRFEVAARRLRRSLARVKHLRDPVLLRVMYSAFKRLAVFQERVEGVRPVFSEVPSNLDEHDFFYGFLRW